MGIIGSEVQKAYKSTLDIPVASPTPGILLQANWLAENTQSYRIATDICAGITEDYR